jgi:hypothetical protein
MLKILKKPWLRLKTTMFKLTLNYLTQRKSQKQADLTLDNFLKGNK